ncbi:MAG TPA: T9SS type A sorting domain-containing protein, partial [Flavisolibacter sp.]|nr:T9SS type A sorting domain-containing protein [Flavisolibacter sp.]
NPATNQIQLSGLPSSLYQIEILNSEGRLLKKFNTTSANQLNIDISDLPKNIYILKIKTQCTTTYQKFMKD